MAGTGRAPSKRCQNVSVPDGACAELCLRTRSPHIASMSQKRINPTFPDFRTFRTRTRSSFLNPDYIYIKITMKKNTTRKEGPRGAFVRAHVRNVRNVRKSANPHKTFVSSLFYVCGCRVRRHSSAHDTRRNPAPCLPDFRPRKKKGPLFFACMFACSVLSTATQGAVNAEPAFTGRFMSAGILSSRLVPAGPFFQRDGRTMRCRSCDTRVFPRHAEK